MFWTCEPLWAGQQVFIIGGGPSVDSQRVEQLKGRRVIVVNSSVHKFPWADILFFGDARWYKTIPENRAAADAFSGLVVTNANIRCENIKRMVRVRPPLASDRTSLAIQKTSLTAAINLAVHLGAGRIVLLGADGRKGSDGRTHHHQPHKWPVRKGCWDEHRQELATLVEPLKKLGIPVINASPGSAWDLWPVTTLIEVLNDQINCL